MYNWSVDIAKLKKDPEQFAIWRLEQMINFGLGKEKLSGQELEQYWPRLTLDPDKKNFLAFLLWGKKSLAPGK